MRSHNLRWRAGFRGARFVTSTAHHILVEHEGKRAVLPAPLDMPIPDRLVDLVGEHLGLDLWRAHIRR
jgi:hypothetical protein